MGVQRVSKIEFAWQFGHRKRCIRVSKDLWPTFKNLTFHVSRISAKTLTHYLPMRIVTNQSGVVVTKIYHLRFEFYCSTFLHFTTLWWTGWLPLHTHNTAQILHLGLAGDGRQNWEYGDGKWKSTVTLYYWNMSIYTMTSDINRN